MEEVKKAIDTFADTKQQQGAKQLFITLTKSVLNFENNLITLTIENETQREQLMNLKQELLDELRKKLQNNAIALDISVSKIQTSNKVYKPSDVFKNMADKNPALLELKKRFDLEIDY